MDHVQVQQESIDGLFTKIGVDISKIEGGLQRIEDSMQEDTREAASETLDAPERAIAPTQIQRGNPEKRREIQGRGQQRSLAELLRDLRAPGSEERWPLTSEIRNICDIALALDPEVTVMCSKDDLISNWNGQKESYYMSDGSGYTSWYGIFINGMQVGIAKLTGVSVYKGKRTLAKPKIEQVVTLPQYHDAVAMLAKRYVRAIDQVAYDTSVVNLNGLNSLGQNKLKEIYRAQQEVAKARPAQPLVLLLADRPGKQRELSMLCQQFTTEVVRPNTYRVFAIPLEREPGRPIRARHHFPIGVVEYKDESNAEVSGYQTLPGFEEAFMAYLSTANPSNSRKDLFKDLHARAEEQAQARRLSLLSRQRRIQQKGQEATL